MVKLVAIIIESLFENCRDSSDCQCKFDCLLSNFTIVSINQVCRVIQRDQIPIYYNLFKHTFNPIYSDSLLDGNTLLISFGSKDASEKYHTNINADIIFFTEKQISNYFQSINLVSNHFRTVTRIEEINECVSILSSINEKITSAKQHIDSDRFDDASRDYKQIADLFFSLGLVCTAKNYYAYAAIASERTEKWRKVSYLWYCAFEPLGIERDYLDYNSLEHSYPSISFEKWSSFNELEKRGRALQYAAYSNDNHNGPSDSYWIFEAAAHEYLKAGNYERAIECAVSATNRYAHSFHIISPDLLEFWNILLNDPRSSEEDDLLYISFCDIYRNLNLYRSEDADFFYVECKKIQERQLLKKKKYGKFFINKIWSASTYYGTKISRITFLSLLLILVFFPFAFYMCLQPDCATELIGSTTVQPDFFQTILHCVSISLDIFMGVNTPSEATGSFHFLILAETFYAYIAMVIISSSLIGKILSQKI